MARGAIRELADCERQSLGRASYCTRSRGQHLNLNTKDKPSEREAMSIITEPLRLAVGSHKAGSGRGCAMNVISWENGDSTITDYPACSDRLLARIVQRVNDDICTHRTGDLLCPPCSSIVLELGHRTVGTGDLPLTDLERRRVWVKIAADQARAVHHLVKDERKAGALRCIEAAEAWADDPSDENLNEAIAARREFYAAAAAAYAAYAAAYAAYAADDAAAYAAADDDAAYAAAADAADDAAYAAAADARLDLARRAIDLFERLTGHIAASPAPQVTEQAIACMLQKEHVHAG